MIADVWQTHARVCTGAKPAESSTTQAPGMNRVSTLFCYCTMWWLSAICVEYVTGLRPGRLPPPHRAAAASTTAAPAPTAPAFGMLFFLASD